MSVSPGSFVSIMHLPDTALGHPSGRRDWVRSDPTEHPDHCTALELVTHDDLTFSHCLRPDRNPGHDHKLHCLGFDALPCAEADVDHVQALPDQAAYSCCEAIRLPVCRQQSA